MAAKNWREVRAELPKDEAQVAAHRDRLRNEVRAARLAEARQRRCMTQATVADAMGVSQARVSAIESGDLISSEVATLARYVAALGGRLELIADFGDERLVLG